jgi:hypothetical protein
MLKLSDTTLNDIRSASELIPHGLITLIMNKNMPDVDVVGGKREEIPKVVNPGCNKVTVLRPGGLHQG